MKLQLIANNQKPELSPPRGKLELVNGIFCPKPPKRAEVKQFAFQIFAPDLSIERISKSGTWNDFKNYMDMVSFQSMNRELIFDENAKAYVLACARIAPIIDDEMGEIQNISLLRPIGRDTPILLLHENLKYFRPFSK